MKNTIKNIYFIDRFPLTKDFYIRFEIKKLTSYGYNVQFLDLSYFLKRKVLESTIGETLVSYNKKFDTKDSFRYFVKERGKDSIFISTVPFVASSAWMYLAFFSNKCNYILVNFLSFPIFKSKQNWWTKKKKKLNYLVTQMSVHKLKNKHKEVLAYSLAKSNIYPAKMIISSTSIDSVRNNVLIDDKTIRRYSFSSDYKYYEKICNNPPLIEGDYAVFIDQYFYHHPDFKTGHIKHNPADIDAYYSRINVFLQSIRDTTGLKIVIASHPRRHNKQEADFSDDFQVLYNNTAELINHSKLVLMHFSTAISLAVICEKPFLLMNSELFAGNIDLKIRGFADYFNKHMLSIDAKLNIENLDVFNVDKVIYDKYKYSYILHPEAKHETFSEKITGFINSHV